MYSIGFILFRYTAVPYYKSVTTDLFYTMTCCYQLPYRLDGGLSVM